MPSPKVTELAGTYILEWENVKVEAHHIVPHKDGDLTGLITITINTVDLQITLAPYKINFQATRQAILKDLEDKTSSVNWRLIIEQLCHEVAARVYKFEKPQKLAVVQQPEPEYLIKPLLVKGHPTVIYGQGGVGKSTFALFLTLLLENDENCPSLEVAQAKCLYLDWESSFDEHSRKASLLVRGNAMEMGVMPLYMRCYKPITDIAAELWRIIEEEKITFVVVDSIVAAVSGAGVSPNDAEGAAQLYSVIRTWGDKVTVLLLGHESKESLREKRGQIIGHINYTNMARAAWELKGKSVDDEESEGLNQPMRLSLFHRKHNLTSYFKPLGFEIAFRQNETLVKSIDPLQEHPEQMSIPNQIMSAIKDKGKISTANLMSYLEVPQGRRNYFDVTLGRLKKKGLIAQLGEFWVLPARVLD